MIANLPNRLRLAAAITIPLGGLEMTGHALGWSPGTIPGWPFIMAAGATVVVFAAGGPLLVKGWQSFQSWKLNMYSLIAPGVLITYGYSLLALLAPGFFPVSFRVHGHVPSYFEAAAMITTLVLLGRFLEERAERHTGGAVEALARLAPTRACVLRNGGEEWVAVSEVQAGDRIRLRAGDRVPVDGRVLEGRATVDESMLTGEPLPATRTPGGAMIGGTLLQEGAVVMETEKVGPDTVLSHIIRMVESAQAGKAPIQRVADRVTGVLVPVVLAIATMTFLAWWVAGPDPALRYALMHMLTVLMITCPCALGLATPVSIVTGLGRGATAGILIKQASTLERLSTINTLVLDKTGTLTTGRYALHACLPITPGTENRVLRQAASLEHLSRHPLALAITEGAKAWGIVPDQVEDFRSEAGGGLSGTVGGRQVAVGRVDWLAGQQVNGFAPLEAMARTYEEQGRTVVWVSVDGSIAGIVVLSDELKPNAMEAVQSLRRRGIRLLIITGDNPRAAATIGRQLGIDEVHAGVRPGDKSGHVEDLRRRGAVVAMAGDGINDAPALAAADVGIAVGTGTDIAVSSGDVILMKGGLMDLVRAVDLSRAVMRNIRQNLFFAFGYNALMIPLAAGVLYPWTGLLLNPVVASAAMSASSVTVILNALRLRRLPLPARNA